MKIFTQSSGQKSLLCHVCFITILARIVRANAVVTTKEVKIPDDHMEPGDTVRSCRVMARNGGCASDREHMLKYCKGTCALNIFSDKDKLDWCDKAAESGQCLFNAANMWRECPETCRVKEDIPKLLVRRVHDESFYGLSAKMANGKKVSFENYEGLYTIIVNVAKLNDENKTATMYAELELLMSRFPHAVQVIVFPFDIPESPDHCTAAEGNLKKVHLMEDAILNGFEPHPVYQYLKDLFGIDYLSEKVPTFFLVNTVGNLIEAHIGGHPAHIEKHLRARTRHALD